MLDYPDLKVDSPSYQEEATDGSTLERAEDGTPRILILYPVQQRTLTITHKALTAAEQRFLEEFYEGAKFSRVRFKNPRYGDFWSMLMVGPPRFAGMVSTTLADMQMTLTGVRIQ